MKKLFSLLLAICLIAGLLPVVASAAGETAKVSIISGASGTYTTLEITEGGAPKYMITEDGLAHEQTANEDNYNIMFAYEDGKPTIFLRDAELVAPKGKMCMYISTSDPEEYVLYVESDSSLTADENYAVRVSGSHFRVTGEGKLSLSATEGIGIGIYDAQIETDDARYDITLDDANVELYVENKGNGRVVAGFGNHVRNFTVSGGTLKAKLNNSCVLACLPYTVKGTGDKINSNLYITNSPEIDVEQVGGTQSGFGRVENGIYIDSGNIKIRHGGTSAFYAGQEFKISGGTIDAVGGPFSYSPESVVLDFSEYIGDYTIIVCNSIDGKNAVQYDPEKAFQQDRYVYFKITPGASYEVAVKNGTADASVVEAGTTVTITARIAPEGKAFDKWVIDNGDITLADPTASTTTFVMPKENVKVTATYKDVEDAGNDTNTNTGNDTNTNTGNDTNTNTGNDTNSNTGNDTNTNTGNDTNTNTGNDANTNTGNNKVDIEDDNAESDGKRAKKKGNGTVVVFVVMIVLLTLAIAAVVVFTVITIKRLKPAEETEEANEEDAENAE